MRTEADMPLFTFEYDVIYWCNRFWLVELCVWWNGETQIMEMVEIQENIDEYIE